MVGPQQSASKRQKVAVDGTERAAPAVRQSKIFAPFRVSEPPAPLPDEPVH